MRNLSDKSGIMEVGVSDAGIGVRISSVISIPWTVPGKARL